MKIKFKTESFRGNITYLANEVADVPDQFANQFIAEGRAVSAPDDAKITYERPVAANEAAGN